MSISLATAAETLPDAAVATGVTTEGEVHESAAAKPVWRLAPIRYWGNVVYDFREERVAGVPRVMQNLISTDLNATSYLWQPWVAIVTAGLGISVAKVSDSESAGTDTFLTGRVRLNLFPQSRFPFEVRAEHGDTRVDSGAGPSIDYKYTLLSLQQRYRPVESNTQYSMSFDHYRQDATDSGRTTRNALMLDATFQPRPDQTASIGMQWNQNRRSRTGDETRYNTLVARHLYSPNSAMSVDSGANVTYVLDDVGSTQSEVTIVQANSIGFWRSSTAPLTMTGSVRLFALRVGNEQGNENQSRSVVGSGTLGATYAMTNNLRLSTSLSMTAGKTGDAHIESSVASVGASYDSPTADLGAFSYDWFGGASASHVSGTRNDGAGFNGQLGHRLSRNFAAIGQSRIGVSVGQSASIQTGAGTDDTRQFTNNASITWGGPTNGASSFARFSVADSRFVDGKRLHFQLMNFQLTRSDSLSRNASFSGTLTWQRTRQSAEEVGTPTELLGDRGFRTSTSADLTYQHERIFSVPRLRFLSQLKVNRDETLQLIGTPEERESRFWENRLEYRIGRLESRFLVRVGDIDHRRRNLVMWKLIRQF